MSGKKKIRKNDDIAEAEKLKKGKLLQSRWSSKKLEILNAN